MCYFCAKFDYFLFTWRVKFAFGGWQIFWRFLQSFNGKIGGFVYKFKRVLGSGKRCKDPPNTYHREIHYCVLCKVVFTSADCFSPVDTLYLLRLQWSARHVTDRCSRRVLAVVHWQLPAWQLTSCYYFCSTTQFDTLDPVKINRLANLTHKRKAWSSLEWN